MPRVNPFLPEGTRVGDQLVNTSGYLGCDPETIWTVYQGMTYDTCIAWSNNVPRYTGEGNHKDWVLLGKVGQPKGKPRYKDWIKSHE